MRSIISILMIAAAIGVFYLGVDPAYQNVKSLRLQQADYNKALDNVAQLRQRRNDLVATYNSISKDDIDRSQKLLPDGVDNIRLILDINSMAAKYGMSIKSIKISQADATVTSAPGSSQNPVGSIQLSFSVTTSYENFLQFMQDLETSLRIVNITTLSFSPDDKTNTTNFNVSLTTYWLK